MNLALIDFLCLTGIEVLDLIILDAAAIFIACAYANFLTRKVQQ